MPLIKIVEQDLTTPGVMAQETDVVYIPGFVDTTQDNLNTEDGYVGIEAFKPTYFSDVKSFETLCGKQGAKFETIQRYTDLIKRNPDKTYSGFDSKAIPQHRVMFYEGTIDPSYIMAKELLTAGLTIVYERINRDPDYIELKEEPEDWQSAYISYFTNSPVYRPISSTVAPELFTQHYEGEKGDRTGTFYTLDEKINDEGKNELVYTKITDNDNLFDLEGNFIKACYSRNDKTFYKFTNPDDTVEPKFETTVVENKVSAMYYTATITEVTFNTETKAANKFYTVGSDGVYTLDTTDAIVAKTKYYSITPTPLLEKPLEWGDMNVFTVDTTGKNRINKYTPVVFTDQLVYTEDTFYQKDDDFGFVLLTGNTEPEIFTPDTVFTVTKFPTEDADGKITIPEDWVVDFIGYCEEEYEKVLIESEDDEAPEFNTLVGENKPGVFKLTNFINIETAYDALAKVFDSSRDQGLTDMGSTNIKYLTSGGYPVYEYNKGSLVNAMKSVANTRGDCVAFIDHTNNPYRTTNVNLESSLYATVKGDDALGVNGEFATMFTPWMNYTRVSTDKNESGEASPTMVQMSATFGYLLALADSLKTNASWLAVAGATRGQVPNLAQVATPTPITNGTADAMQPRDAVSINAITEINPYGQTIWGNRTLKNNATEGNLTATSFLNMRHLISDVKKVCYSTARALTFEQNNDVLWVNFKSKISPTLDKMVSGYGISGYKIVRDTEHEKASEKATLCAKIVLYPTYAVEDFYITIVLTDEEVGVSE